MKSNLAVTLLCSHSIIILFKSVSMIIAIVSSTLALPLLTALLAPSVHIRPLIDSCIHHLFPYHLLPIHSLHVSERFQNSLIILTDSTHITAAYRTYITYRTQISSLVILMIIPPMPPISGTPHSLYCSPPALSFNV